MEAFNEILINLQQILSGVFGLAAAIVVALLPWIPLFAWIAFWLFAVNWKQLRDVLLSGGWIGVVLLGLVAVLVWGSVSPPLEGRHFIFGLTVSNFVGKTVYVTMLICIMYLCGSVQLSGCCGNCCVFDDEESAAEPAH